VTSKPHANRLHPGWSVAVPPGPRADPGEQRGSLRSAVPVSGWRGWCPGGAYRTVAPESLADPGELALGRLCDIGRMTAWKDVERAEPEFAQRVRGLFDGHRHKTIATLRADGSPRISGIEVAFEDGELAFSSMSNARKGADLGRDPRFALHSATIDPVEGAEAQWPGEAKISGRAIHAEPLTGGSDGDRFYADIAEVVHTHLNEKATMLVVEWWTPTHGLCRIERE
jgi:hypothetical protein